MKIKSVLLIFLYILGGYTILSAQSFRVACWNVENYFDIYNDSLTNDDSFTPQGDHRWTAYRFAHKRNSIYKTIVALAGDSFNYPSIIGLAEVENAHVLRELCFNTPLRRIGYNYIHYDSPDLRGIDCALLYLPSRFEPIYSQRIDVSDSTRNFYTRDILLVAGLMDRTDTCYCLVNHFPSKLGGGEADLNRVKVAQKLKYILDTIQFHHPTAVILAMGDFNADPTEEVFTNVFQFKEGLNSNGFYDLVSSIPIGQGTYKYHDTWSCIDHIISNRLVPIHIFSPDFLLLPDKKYLGNKINRTYIYIRYQGGISDHLPIYIDL